LKNCDLDKVEEFVQEVEYPIVIKPDHGSGASMTTKITNHSELVRFFNHKPADIAFIAEEFIDGHVLTYDGLVDQDGQVRFDASHFFDQNIMTVVNSNDHLHYYCLKEIPENVRQAGQSILKTFGIKERFFHIELFKSLKNGKLYGLEVNMRPPGAWMTDSINYTYDIDIYHEWANLVVHNRVECNREGKYFTAYASRKNHKKYAYSHDDILRSYSSQLVHHHQIEDVFSQAMGNYAYQFRAETFDQVEAIVAFVQEEKRG